MTQDTLSKTTSQSARLSSAGVRSVAIFEGAKGVIVLAVGFGLLSLLHRDIQAVAESIVRHLHLGPAGHYSEIFLRAASHLQNGRLGWFAAGAFAYATVRLVEAYGLWHERPWAEWLAIVSAGLYLPVEVFEFWRHHSVLGGLIMTGNLLLVAGLLYVRLSEHRTSTVDVATS
ncbi:MAG: DUF2127 domain-containing protein [Vicinamibacteria bacterium]